jgi:hypothetical protein
VKLGKTSITHRSARPWNKATVLLSPNSVHKTLRIPLQFVFLDLAKTCKIWDEFGKLCANSKKAAGILKAILTEKTEWSFANRSFGTRTRLPLFS